MKREDSVQMNVRVEAGLAKKLVLLVAQINLESSERVTIQDMVDEALRALLVKYGVEL